MTPVLIALVALVVVLTAWAGWRRVRNNRIAEPDRTPATGSALVPSPEYPPAGLLVSEAVMRAAGSGSASIWEALEQAAVPVALEYYPVDDAEIARYRTIPVNGAAQDAVVNIVKALNPKSPTLYRVVLPKGAELAKAAGEAGFRGFARNGNKISAQALLKPVAAGGAIAAGWPVIAVGGAVMALDMVAQKEMREHQRKVERLLSGMEKRHYELRISQQRATDEQLSRAVNLMLDGQNPHMELALKDASLEFHQARQFLEEHHRKIESLVQADGMIDHRHLEYVLGKPGEDSKFFREFHMALGSLALRRKALVAEAAAAALKDPDNPFTALRRSLEMQAGQLEEAEATAAAITERLSAIDLKGGWSVRKAVKKRDRIRGLAAPPKAEDEVEIRFLRNAAGEIVRVIAIDPGGESVEADEVIDAELVEEVMPAD